MNGPLIIHITFSVEIAQMSVVVKKMCKYDERCTRPDCHFEHSASAAPKRIRKPCKFGVACTRPDCFFVHSASAAPKATAQSPIEIPEFVPSFMMNDAQIQEIEKEMDEVLEEIYAQGEEVQPDCDEWEGWALQEENCGGCEEDDEDEDAF